MVNFFGVNHLAARARKAPLVAAVVVGLFFLAAAIVYACCGEINWDPGSGGVMPPDKVVQKNGDGQIFVYDVAASKVGSITLNRNRAGYITIVKKGGQYLISDPRGTGETIIRFPAPTR
jgi:hypothetical protein